jgi:hypothetical protein
MPSMIGRASKPGDHALLHAAALRFSTRPTRWRSRPADGDNQPNGIPATISLQYVNKLEPIAHPTLETQDPWHKEATIDPDSGDRFAIAQEQSTPAAKDGVTESLFAYWSATRAE